MEGRGNVTKYDDSSSNAVGGARGREAGQPLESPGIGKSTLVQLAPGPPAAVPSKPGSRTLVEQLAPLQRRAGVDAAADAGPPPSAGGGTPLPPDVRTQMEAALGGNFTAVRVHTSSYAESIGARAFTRGTDLVFAPGAYDPKSPQGLQLIGHELTHVVQQAQGRVPANTQLGGAPANDDPALEQEADEMGAKAARAEPTRSHPEPHTAGSDTHGAGLTASVNRGPTQMKASTEADTTAPPSGQPYVDELDGHHAEAASEVASGPPIQRHPTAKKREYVRFKIIVAKDMTGEQLKAAANLQVFGVAAVSAEWKNVQNAYTPADSPVEINVEASLLRRLRGAVNTRKGIDTDENGKVLGADARAKDFLTHPASDEKSALIAEIDRRYHTASGATPGTKIKPGEPGNKELWRSLRDEVLFQHQYIANLPDKVKALIRISIKGRELTPADYDQLFRVAKKIEALPPGAAADYANKITGTATDLATFEAAIDGHRAELATREHEDSERTTAQNKLLGLEEVYKLYKRYVQATNTEMVAPGVATTKKVAQVLGAKAETADDLKQQLEQQLPRHGFASIAELASYIARFIHAFEEGAARITVDMLARYAGKLYKESQRYQDPAVIKDLHGKLGGFRAQHQELHKNATIWNDYAKTANADHERGRLPGNGHIHARPPTAEQAAAGEQAKAAKANAEAQIKDLSKEYPIFAEDDLPADKRLDKVKLAQADESTLASVLQAHIADRSQVVASAREQLEGNHQLIYKMDKLMPTFYAEMDIQPSSIHDEIIKDKMHEDAIAKIVGGVLLAIVAIALTVVSLGTATPAIVAAGASIGAVGLSTYMAYEEYKEYAAEHAMADAGFANDPSVVWLVLAIVGAGVDMAVAVKAVHALAPAAKALEAGGELADFTKAVEALEKSKQLERKSAGAAAKAAAARKSYQAAKGELGAALGKMYSLPGPLADPEVYRAVVKMAVAKIREGGHSLSAFIADIRAARTSAKLGELTPEDLAKVKQAWEEAKILEATEQVRYEKLLQQIPDVTKLDVFIAKTGDAAKLERLLKVFPEAELETIFAQLKDTRRLVVMIDHVGADSGAKTIRQWMAKGQVDKMNAFLENLAGGTGRELADTTAMGAKAVIIDSQTASALAKAAAGTGLQDGEKIMVKYVKSLPPGTELRVGNVTVGEVGSGAVQVKGLPIEVARDSAPYKQVLAELERMNVGSGKGVRDRALVADAFFARTEPGVVPRFATADTDIFNKLATEAGIDLRRLGGKKLSDLHPDGFEVTVGGQKLHVVPIQ